MQVFVRRYISESEVMDMFHGLSLLNHSEIKPYENADIRITTDAVYEQSAFYVLKNRLDFIKNLHAELKKIGLNMFDLRGGIELSIDGGESYQLVPPVVETTPEGGKVLLDGVHRAFVARELGVPLRVVDINGSNPDWPVYAKANPGGWSDVKVCDEVPAVKKLYRNLPERNLTYRDLYRSLPGSSGIREIGTR